MFNKIFNNVNKPVKIAVKNIFTKMVVLSINNRECLKNDKHRTFKINQSFAVF